MKVLHVIPSLSKVHGGPTRALALMEQALVQQGIAVETATTDDEGPGKRSGKPCGRPVSENGAVRWYFRKNMEFYKPSLAFAGWMAREVHRFDLVHIHALFSFTSTASGWAARRAGVPYIVRPLGTLNRYGMEQRRPWLKQVSLDWIDGPLLRRAAAVHFTSVEEAAEARRLGLPLREAVIPLAVEPLESGRQLPELDGAPRLLFLSRLDPKKNLEALLDCLALLKEDLPRVHLVVAGGGAPDYVAGLKQRAHRLGLSQSVTWAGHVEGASKADLLASADMFVLPSLSENFGIAAAEALSAGLPCILGAGVAIAADVERAGAGVAVGSEPQAIALAVRELAANEELRAKMSRSGRQLARSRYSTQVMGQALKSLYSEILRA